FYLAIKKNIIKIKIIDEATESYEIPIIHKYFFEKDNEKVKITEARFKNIKASFDNWNSLITTNISHGYYYRSFNISEFEFILPKNTFHNRYEKYLYMIDESENKNLVITHILTGKKYLINDRKLNDWSRFYDFGILEEDW
ncbi:23518_t:CDS:1, partial [Cetraspora pellucida]